MHKAKAKNAASSTDQIKQAITTYTIDVFNAQQNPNVSALLQSMAHAGGGKHFVAHHEAQILAALQKIPAEIQPVHSTFTSASLPVNSPNPTQNSNQAFIRTFRPEPHATPAELST